MQKNLRLTCFKLFSTKYDTKLILKSRAQANLSKIRLLSNCLRVRFFIGFWNANYKKETKLIHLIKLYFGDHLKRANT